MQASGEEEDEGEGVSHVLIVVVVLGTVLMLCVFQCAFIWYVEQR